MVRHQITLTEAQTERLEKEKRDTGLKKSDLIRRAWDRYIEERDGE